MGLEARKKVLQGNPPQCATCWVNRPANQRSSEQRVRDALRFFLDTQPQPPGSLGDPAPPNSKVQVEFNVAFLRFN